jgi:hypothetical protein
MASGPAPPGTDRPVAASALPEAEFIDVSDKVRAWDCSAGLDGGLHRGDHRAGLLDLAVGPHRLDGGDGTPSPGTAAPLAGSVVPDHLSNVARETSGNGRNL